MNTKKALTTISFICVFSFDSWGMSDKPIPGREDVPSLSSRSPMPVELPPDYREARNERDKIPSCFIEAIRKNITTEITIDGALSPISLKKLKDALEINSSLVDWIFVGNVAMNPEMLSGRNVRFLKLENTNYHLAQAMLQAINSEKLEGLSLENISVDRDKASILSEQLASFSGLEFLALGLIGEVTLLTIPSNVKIVKISKDMLNEPLQTKLKEDGFINEGHQPDEYTLFKKTRCNVSFSQSSAFL